MSDIIPENINPNENLTRCIFHHLHYSRSKKKLKHTAFLPPPGRNDVSVLRRDYTPDDTFCKKHCQSIRMPSHSYVGIAVILGRHIAALEEEKTAEIRITIQATPLDENNKRISEEIIYSTMPGLPMHADIVYNIPTVKEGKPSVEHRAMAQFLCKNACFYSDENLKSELWAGDGLIWKENRDA